MKQHSFMPPRMFMIGHSQGFAVVPAAAPVASIVGRGPLPRYHWPLANAYNGRSVASFGLYESMLHVWSPDARRAIRAAGLELRTTQDNGPMLTKQCD